MKTNISVLNAIMRITCGLTALAWATSRLSRRHFNFASLLVALMGAMKVGEGIHRYCPVTEMMKQNMHHEDNHSESHEKENENEKEAHA